MMVAAQAFNAHEDQEELPVYGAVTTGSIWRFLKLKGSALWIDRPEYYLHQLGKILSIVQSMAG
jgi:hypothetical protein